MKILNFITCSKAKYSPKPMSAFTIVVEDSWNFNFAIQNFWRTVQLFGANHGQKAVDRRSQ
jgi:hypothetical protein